MKVGPNHAVDQYWLNELGGLHDARIRRVQIVDGDLLIVIDNLLSNFDLEIISGRFRLVGVVGSPKIDERVTSEVIMDIFVESGVSTKLRIVCFGQHVIEAEGERLAWEPEAST